MRLSEGKIKEAILCPEEEVFMAALGYFTRSHTEDKSLMPLVIEAVEKHGRDNAFPILKKYGFTATLFIYLDFIGIPGSSVTWKQLKEMKSSGFEVGSHTLTHCNLTKKQKEESEQAYLERIEKELILSKQIIDKKLNQNTVAIAFPYGAYNQKVLDLCEKAGYKLGLSVKRGGNPFFSNPFL